MSVKGEKTDRAEGWAGLVLRALPLIVFIAIAALAVFLYLRQQWHAQELIEQRQELNQKQGLPRDYPRELIPLYPGLEIVDTERGEWHTDENEPMDKWYVHGQIDESKEVLFEYYNDLLLNKGLRQTQYISIPTGYGVDYADDLHVIKLIVEKKSTDELMQVEITIFRLKKH